MSSQPQFLQLFDPPGPRGRARVRAWSAVSVVVLGVAVVISLRRLADRDQLDWERWHDVLEWSSLQFYLRGLLATVKAGLAVTIIGGAAGLLIAVARLSRFAVVRGVARAYTEIARTFPVLVLVYIFLFALPDYGFNPDRFWKLVLPLSIAAAAAFAEIFRAGLLSIPIGQREAAMALGTRPYQSMLRVQLPQALRRVTPSLVSQSVSVLKDTSLGFIVSYAELLQNGRVMTTFTGWLVQSYAVVGTLYFIPNFLLSLFARRLQRRVDRLVALPSGTR